jgi:DNA-binding ferritin-like protein (Dps family)
LELVGEDVGEFAENMLHEIQAKTRINELKRKMNERVAKEINKGK